MWRSLLGVLNEVKPYVKVLSISDLVSAPIPMDTSLKDQFQRLSMNVVWQHFLAYWPTFHLTSQLVNFFMYIIICSWNVTNWKLNKWQRIPLVILCTTLQSTPYLILLCHFYLCSIVNWRACPYSVDYN